MLVRRRKVCHHGQSRLMKGLFRVGCDAIGLQPINDLRRAPTPAYIGMTVLDFHRLTRRRDPDRPDLRNW
jgi:hypothetical protein